MTATEGFRTGAIALLDVLGFKGIWRRPGTSPKDILDRMRRIEGTVTSTDAFFAATMRKHPVSGAPLIASRNIVVSDSIFVAAWSNVSRPDATALCLALVEQTCRSIIVSGLAEDGFPLHYRGVITVGEFAADEQRSFVVGPAVDEVAALEREAEGAFIWYTPSAAQHLAPHLDPTTEPSRVMRYGVPLKDGRSFETLVVNPLFADPSLEEKLLRNMFQPLPERTPLDVHIKRQNLAAFCRHVNPELCERLSDVINAGL